MQRRAVGGRREGRNAAVSASSVEWPTVGVRRARIAFLISLTDSNRVPWTLFFFAGVPARSAGDEPCMEALFVEQHVAQSGEKISPLPAWPSGESREPYSSEA